MKKSIYEGHENKDKCENTIFFLQIMVHKNFERITKRIILTEIFYSWSALNSIKPIFQIFWLYLNICKNDLNLFLNGTNLMCNRIIIYVLFIMPFCFKSLTKRYIFQLIKYEHRGVSRRIDSGNRNFASVKPQQIFHFFLNQNILFPECPKMDQTYISNIWIYAKNQN